MNSLRGRGGAGVLASLVLAVTLVLAGGAGAAHAAGDNKTREVEMKARETFAAGNYAEALQLFAKLYAETLHPVYLRNIGRCHQKMREPQKAIDAFKDYLAKSPKSGKDKITADERTEIEGYIKEMEDLRDQQAKTPVAPATPPPVQPLPPGPATPPPGYPPPPSTTPPAADPNAPAVAATLTAPPPAPEQHRSVFSRPVFWVVVGAVVVGAVVTTLIITSGGGSKPNCPAGVMGCM